MSDDGLELIQTKIAFLEHANAELSEVVYRQQRQIDALAAQVAALAERLRAVQSEDRPRPPEDERPPHY